MNFFKKFFFLIISIYFFNLYAETTPQMPRGWSNGTGGEITNLAELRWLSETTEAWDEAWILSTNINASDTRTWNPVARDTIIDGDTLIVKDSLGNTVFDYLGLSPIGDFIVFGAHDRQGVPFVGSFDGQEFTISNLYINRPEERFVGLFGSLDSSRIQNIVVDSAFIQGKAWVGLFADAQKANLNNIRVLNSDISGESGVGGLVGSAIIGTIADNVYVQASVSGELDIGGLAGEISSSSIIKNCRVFANVEGDAGVGGIVGESNVDAELHRCFYQGNVEGRIWIGGAVGSSRGGNFSEVFTSGTVTATFQRAGGFIGMATDTDTTRVSDVFSLSTVTAPKYSGGLIGYNYEGVIKNSHYFGELTVSDSSGGLVGVEGLDSISSSYFDMDLSGHTIAIGSDSSNALGTGLNSVDFADRTKFLGWDFDSVWAIGSIPELSNIARPYFQWQLDVFSLKFQDVDGGSIQGEKQQTIGNLQQPKTVTAIPSAHRFFDKWINSQGETISELNPLRLSPNQIVSDTTIFPVYGFNRYRVMTSSAENGEIEGNADQIVNAFDSITSILAIPDEGYHFDSWRDAQDNVIDSINPLEMDSVTAHFDLTAHFSINRYSIQFSSDTNGQVQGTTSQLISHGDTSGLVFAVPDSGYKFIGWFTNQDELLDSNSSLAIVAFMDSSITARFELHVYDVEFKSGSHGVVHGQPIQIIGVNEPALQVEAIPDTGYHFDAWYNDSNEVVSKENPFVLEKVESDTALTASFNINIYTLMFSTDTNGFLEGEQSQEVAHGLPSTAISAIPNEDFEFAGWVDSAGNLISIENPLVLPSLRSDSALIAVFVPFTYDLVIQIDSNGSVTGDTLQQLGDGFPSRSIEAVPDSGYLFEAWYNEQGQIVSTENPFLLDSIVSDSILIARFMVSDEVELIFSSTDGGSILGKTFQKIRAGRSAEAVMVIPDRGYQFSGWYDQDEMQLGTGDTLTFENIQRDEFVEARFKKITYKFSGATVGAGTVNLDFAEAVYGDTVNYIVRSNVSSKLDSIIYNGENITKQQYKLASEFFLQILVQEDGHLIAYFSTSAPILNQQHFSKLDMRYLNGILSLKTDKAISYELFTLHGNLVSSSQNQKSLEWNIDAKALANGIYFIKVMNQNYFQLKPFYKN